MEIFTSRHVQAAESLRLGVEAGWYITKISGTFVNGPIATEAACATKLAELNPPVKRK